MLEVHRNMSISDLTDDQQYLFYIAFGLLLFIVLLITWVYSNYHTAGNNTTLNNTTLNTSASSFWLTLNIFSKGCQGQFTFPHLAGLLSPTFAV